MTKAIIVRNDNTLSPAGLKLVEKCSSEGKTQRYIAAELGIPLKTFEKMLERGKGNNPERLAWEAGHARYEQRAADALQSEAFGVLVDLETYDAEGQPILDEAGEPVRAKVRIPTSKGHIISLIYLTKARLGWSEKPHNLVQDNRIQITLPGAMSGEDFFKGLGIDQPLDFRKDKSKAHPMLKDITPQRPVPAGLPAPAVEKPEKEKP